MEEGAAPRGATEILAGLRVVLLRRLWLAAVVVALIGAPASLARAFATGWQPAYVLHLMVAVTILGVHLAGDRLPPVVKRVIIIANPLALGAIGLFGFAMLGNGISTLLFACVITSLLYPVRGTIMVAVVSAALVVSAGMLYVSGGLKLGFDANLFVQDPRAWTNVVFALLLSTAIVLIAMAHYQNSILTLVREVDRQREVILHQALHDQLTGLPHRQLAADRLEMAVLAARRKPAPDALAVLYIDLDGFKSVNDRFGHAAGDAVLAATADRLRRAVRAADSVARLGGDEFLIILQDFGDRARLATLSSGIAQALALPVTHEERELAVAASIGVALFPEHGVDAPSLRHAADTAMYAAKQRGPGNTAFAGDLVAAE